MKSKYHISREDKLQKIYEFIPREQIASMLEDGYSFGMIRDLLLRDYPQIKQNEMLKSTMSSSSQFWRVLIVSGLKVDNEKYLTKPQWWKIQFRFPKHYSEDQIRQQINESSRSGQLKTAEKRRERGNLGNPKFKRADSPLCIEFYTSRGWCENEARKEIRQICSKGAHAALRKCSNSTSSSIEQIFSILLEECGVDYSRQKVIALKDGEKKYCYNFYSYDFLINRTLVEVQGTYFHADPRFFDECDIIFEKTAKSVWEKDSHKKEIAESRGYDVFYFWEHDIVYKKETVIEKISDLFLTR